MEYYSVKPVRLALQPSRQLLALLLLAGGGACMLVAVLPVPASWKLVLCAGILLQAVFHIARDALLRLPGAIVALEVTSQGCFRYQCHSGGWRDAAVRGDSFVTPWLTVLNLRHPGRPRTRCILLLSDSGDGDMLRQLRVWLRWGSQALPKG